jgi:ankyrin repeat protein
VKPTAGAVIDATDNDGSTPLHIAASQSADIIVNELLQNGANADALDKNRRTPLHEALLHRYPSETVVNALLDHCTNVDGQDNDGCTALHYACRKCHLPIIILLRQHGAKSFKIVGKEPIPLKNKDGKLPVDEIPSQLLDEYEPIAVEMKEQLLATPLAGEIEEKET